MLKELRIESFAIIDELVLRMEKGLLVVTGETGAGKSILFNALTLILGKRASVDMIRHGSTQAIVSARFDLNQVQQSHLSPILEERREFFISDILRNKNISIHVYRYIIFSAI